MTEQEFDELIKEAGMFAIEEMETENMKQEKNEVPHKFSKKFEKKMKKFFDKYR